MSSVTVDPVLAGLLPEEEALAYEEARILGDGATGVVVRVRRRADGALRALKILRGDAAARRADVRFQREADALARLDHPAVVRCHGLHRAGETLYLEMDLVDGEPLDHRTARSPLASPEAVTLVARLADGLAAAHALGLIHRDLKPANVIVTEEGSPTLIDFGLVRFTGAAALTDVTRTGELMGSLSYMAPEQIRAEPVTTQTDLWQLGAILYELLTGRPPRDPAHLDAVMRRLPVPPTTPPSSIVKGIPGTLDRLALRAVAAAPADRFPSAADFADACRAFLGSPDAALATVPGGPTAVRRPGVAVTDRIRSVTATPSSSSSSSSSSPSPLSLRHLAAVAGLLVLAVLVASRLAPSVAPSGPGSGTGSPEEVRRASPLLDAAARNDGAAVAGLLAGGAVDVNARGEFDATALHRAAWNGAASMAALLIKAGAEVDARDRAGRTPLHAAAERGHGGVVAVLLEAGANRDERDDDGRRPRDLATEAGHAAVALLLGGEVSPRPPAPR